MLLSTVDIGKALLNTVMGMGTVFVVLVFISWIIGMFKYLNKPVKEEVKKEPAPVVDNVVAQIEETEELSDDSELVAVITAAIAAYEGTAGASNTGFRVRSIKRARR
ncbi:MAG: OadG family protein [Lachnospiraceae bacterium]|nr:OadG family protein [Lachnospiraceae bacterium]